MFMAAYRRTEASARPKLVRETEWVTKSLIEIRRERAKAALRRKQEMDEWEKERIRLIREEANLLIAQGNGALRRMRRERWQGNPRAIIRRICKVLAVNPGLIFGVSRTKRVAFARQAVMYWLARQTLESIAGIGRGLDKDHTSVLHGMKAYVQKRKAMGRHLREAR